MSAREELIRLTKELVAIPSVTDDPRGRAAVIDYIARYCTALPGVHTARVESNGFPSLVAAFNDRPAQDLILNAHVDVVPARPEQFQPFEHDGRIYGRGTQDMKAAAAAMLLLLRDLATSDERPSVAWQFVTDEEIGGENGTGYLLAQGYTGKFLLAGEPTDLKIVNRAKGVLWITIRQEGSPAHGSRPWDGNNPIMPLAQGIVKLLERYPVPTEPVWRTTAVPTTLHGGDAANRVPADCVLELDIRHVPEDAPETILAAVKACFPSAVVHAPRGGPPLETTEDDANVQRLARLIEESTHSRAEFRDEHFASDARYYSDAGIPAVCFGPTGAGLHSHEEWVDIASLEQFYEVIRALARSY